MDAQAVPWYFKARPVAYTLNEKVEKEISRLQELGIIIPVHNAVWAATIGPIVKKDCNIHLCRDCKVTAKWILTPDIHPLPCVEDILAPLEGGMLFSMLDLSYPFQ